MSLLLRWFCRLVSAFLLYAMSFQLWEDLHISMDTGRSFGGSLKHGTCVEQAVVNAALFPLVVYLVYFANWGRLGRQLQFAIVFLCITGLGPLIYIVVSLNYRMPVPGNYMDMEIVIAALFTAFLWLALVLGVYLRWQALCPHKHDTFPQCVTCGYQLTGNVSGICPECGEKI